VNSARLEGLVEKVRSLEDQGARDAALELVQAVVDLYGDGLGRMMELTAEADGGGALLDAFGKDPAISPILLLHGLHPQALESRVRRAVEHPSLAMRGVTIRVLSAIDGAVRIRLDGADRNFEERVREAILEAAPDAESIEVESSGAPAAAGFVPLEQLVAR
jgi:hypothetical protein